MRIPGWEIAIDFELHPWKSFSISLSRDSLQILEIIHLRRLLIKYQLFSEGFSQAPRQKIMHTFRISIKFAFPPGA